MRIVHVTESFGGGVATAILDYVANTPQHDHLLYYATRGDAPIDQASLRSFASADVMPQGHLRKFIWLARPFRFKKGDVVHVHSSLAGLYVRLLPHVRRIVYTPHCYAFERIPKGGAVNKIARAVESLLARRTAVVAACSHREALLARNLNRRQRIVFVPNVGPILESGLAKPEDSPNAGLVVIGAGRLSPQKDPDFFARAVAIARSEGFAIDPVWIGGGDAMVEARLRAAGVRVTGWLNRAAVLVELQSSDVYFHTAAWEGFPLAILEATALQLPIVARHIPAFEGIALPLFVDQPGELTHALGALATLEERRNNARTASVLLADYNSDNQRTALTEAYRLAGASV